MNGGSPWLKKKQPERKLLAKNTWLKLWRSTAKNSLIRNAKASQLFLWMLLEAQWKNKREGGVDLKPGELLTSMPLIQIELNMSKKQARDAIALLESLRIVAHDRDFEGRGLGRGKKTIYRFINWSKYQSQTEEGHESVPPEGTSQFLETAQVEENSHTEQADSSPKNLRTKELNKNLKPLSADADENFMTFYRAYPRKEAKIDAWKAWKQKPPNLQAVLKALAWQSKQEQWTIREQGKLKFVPLPGSYLRGERWTDEPPYQARTEQQERIVPLALPKGMLPEF